MTEKTEKQTLADVRKALAENDSLRLDPGLSDDERSGLEKVAVALREVERELVAETSGEIVERLENASDVISEMARDIRDRVTNMNLPAKILEHLKDAASILNSFLTEAGRW